MTNVAFIIGCEKYNDFEQLPGVNIDIQNVREAFINYCDCSEDHTYVITNGYTGTPTLTATNIIRFMKEKISNLANQQINNVFFYFSGHGYLSDDNKVCFVLEDTVISSPFIGVLTHENITDTLKNLSVQHIILFLDICQDKVVAKGISTNEKIDIDSNYFPKGTIIFYSCFPEHSSYMLPNNTKLNARGSVFTSCLVEALQPKSNCHTVNEISGYLKEKVQEACKKIGVEQSPYTELQDTTLGDVVIATPKTSYGFTVDLNETEKQQINSFVGEIIKQDKGYLNSYGMDLEEQLIKISDFLPALIDVSKTENGKNYFSSDTSFINSVKNINLFRDKLALYRNSFNKSIYSRIKRIFGIQEPTISYGELNQVKDRFIKNMEVVQVELLRRVVFLNRYSEHLSTLVKKICMYIVAAEQAYDRLDSDNLSILKRRVDSLGGCKQNCERIKELIKKHIKYCDKLIYGIQGLYQSCATTFDQVRLIIATDSNIVQIQALMGGLISELDSLTMPTNFE